MEAPKGAAKLLTAGFEPLPISAHVLIGGWNRATGWKLPNLSVLPKAKQASPN
jgi:hypothetical protein